MYKRLFAILMAVSIAASSVLSAPAAQKNDFADDSTIFREYKEAVDVVAAMEIMGGYSDGSFRPKAKLSRGAAAKIICNMLLGPEAATDLPAGKSLFIDVPADSTFAGYIAYCAENQIISGYSDNRFKPSDTLTENAFLKMLLGALGYDPSREQFTGNGWQDRVREQAEAAGLLNGRASETETFNRETAALLILNTLQADMMEYSGTGDSAFPDNESSSRATRCWKGDGPRVSQGNINADQYSGRILKFNKQIAQFGELYFPGLVRYAGNTDEDTVVSWFWMGHKIGSYVHGQRRSESTPILPPTIKNYSFAFENLATSFHYPEEGAGSYYRGDAYPIPLERYVMVYGANALAKQMYQLDWGAGWFGNCYGMAVAAGLLNMPGAFQTFFQNGISFPGGLDLSNRNECLKISLQELIEAAQISQYSAEFCRVYQEHLDDYQGLAEAVSAFQNGEAGPVVICIYGTVEREGTVQESGHALIAYKMEESRDEETGDEEARIHVYDPNFIMNPDRVLTLKRQGNRYSGWSYKLDDMYNWGRAKNGITYIDYASFLDIWTHFGGLEGADDEGQSDGLNYLTLDAADAKIYNQSGILIAEYRNGVLEQQHEDAFPVMFTGITADGRVRNSNQIAIWLPKGQEYKVELTKENRESGKITASLSELQEGIKVETTSRSLILSADDNTETISATILERGCTYRIFDLHPEDDPGGNVIGFSGHVLEEGNTSEPSHTVKAVRGIVQREEEARK